jgi:hypothetical protein
LESAFPIGRQADFGEMKNPFSNTPSVDGVIKAVKLSTSDRTYRRIRIVMYSPDTGETRLVRPERGKLILLRDRGFHPLGLLGWYEKDRQVQTVARLFPWLGQNAVAGEIFGQICDAETARLKSLYEHRDLN